LYKFCAILSFDEWGGRWSTVFDTAAPQREPEDHMFTAGEAVTTEGRSLVLLRREDRV